MASKPLTARQKRILYYLQEYIDTKRYPPSIREIAEAVDASSTSVVFYNLDRLAQRGLIDVVPNIARGIRLKGKVVE